MMDGESLILNGEIVLEGTVLSHDYCQWMDGGSFSSRMVREALGQFDGEVTVRVNSPGGDPFEGEAIRAAFEAHPGRVTVVVGGVAASAASLMIMSADRIEMTAGSILMIHDPSTCVCGTPDELRHHAETGDVLANTYAAVYAARAGMTDEEVRTLMRAETYMGAADAVQRGFADAVVGAADNEPPSELAMQMALDAHRGSIGVMQMCAKHFDELGQRPASITAGDPGDTGAAMAETTRQENAMERDENVQGTPPATPSAPAAQPTMTATPEAVEAAVQAERNRVRGIREMTAAHRSSGQLTEAQVNEVIDAGTPLEQAGNRFMTMLATAEPPAPAGGVRATIHRDETDTRMEGMIQAMMRDFSGPGADYRGLRLRNLAMELAGGRRGFSDVDSIRSGMRATTMMGGAHGVSDFAYITTEVMNRSLMTEYDRRGANWNVVTGTPLQASDFRELHAVRFGGDFQLKTVLENGEYQEATLNDEAEGLKVERRGRTIHLTFEAVVNDDMGAFTRIPREFAMASRVMENSMVWSLIRTNAVLKSDGVALFHNTHKNLAGTAGAISVATVGAGRKVMWEQTAFGSKDKDDFLQIEPNLLIVPPALEVTALQFATGTTPAKDGDANPYKNTIRPVTVPNLSAAAGGSDTAWYLVSEDLPPISVAYLDGYEAPTVQTIEGMNPDKVTMQARHIFGAAPSEYRGAYKNAGA